MNILVTGGASGLGASIVRALATEAGNTIYFTYSKSEAAAKELEAAYANVKGFHCDFADDQSLENLLQAMPGMDLNALVNNANGSIHKEHFYKTNPDVFLDSFRQNVLPALRITQEAMKGFRKAKFGKIVNVISSAVINKPPVGWSEYVANKAYLLAMSKSWATEGVRFNITSNSVSPSFMLTNLTADTDERVVEQITENHPLQKILTADEVASTVIFLLQSSQQINGTNIIMNAGADLV